ncbi:MAG: phosphoribosyltransferase [Burkholderiales bacterium]|jgi:predicted phosphoribosyltransferase|nr:phosphoribosyltransferase [Burkholderiales bacterium]
MYKILKNRAEAGIALADELQAYKNSPDTIILAIPRGGVPVAYEMAVKLNLHFDLMIVCKLGYPRHEEYAIGAVTMGNLVYINPQVSATIDINAFNIQTMIEKERREYLRRDNLYRNNRPLPNVKGKKVILVDDGVATGLSITAVIMVLKQLNPAEIIVAVPVLSPDALKRLSNLVDKVFCLSIPEPFHSMKLCYDDFHQVTDQEVKVLCAKAARRNLLDSV